jgi:hypothetical protein
VAFLPLDFNWEEVLVSAPIVKLEALKGIQQHHESREILNKVYA